VEPHISSSLLPFTMVSFVEDGCVNQSCGCGNFVRVTAEMGEKTKLDVP